MKLAILGTGFIVKEGALKALTSLRVNSREYFFLNKYFFRLIKPRSQ